MTFYKRSVCEPKSLRNWGSLCVLLAVVFVLYHDPFLIFWWPQRPAEKTGVLPLDMATDSIDDMYDGCRSEAAPLTDLFGVFEWHFNRNFSFAWASAEKNAKRPAHKHLKDDHATVVYMYTKMKHIRQHFNRAVKTGKHKYRTDGFKFHYFYFYLTDAIQLLQHNQTSCRTAYHRTWKRFDQNMVNATMRFGDFTWAASSKQAFEFNGNVSCFEIYTCFGADVTYYSATTLEGQVLIPTYEVFTVTHVLRNDPWCRVVYRLQSTKIPRTDINCKLNKRLVKIHFGAGSTHWHGSSVLMMSACVILLIISSSVLIKRKQKCFVAAVLGALLVLITVALMLT
ncbi:T-cell ecto-ADP-ribosyltransferase 2-like [Embiotoca jacksoni]|uniref:T-cell ecto-ADP-ribosyltransferase 2-like n=1 Tax=Embiotoca jacksoni TaxID=100190 RepID=UPI00370495EB